MTRSWKSLYEGTIRERARPHPRKRRLETCPHKGQPSCLYQRGSDRKEDDDLLFGHIDRVDDAIISIPVPEQSLEHPLERCAQACRILDKVGLDSAHNSSGLLLVDHLKIMKDLILPDNLIVQAFSPAPQWSDIWRSCRSASQE